MAKKKREPRTDKINKVNLLRPVNIFELGTENDPCFGKLYDPTAPECKRCGDFEVCAIVFGQNNHKLRDKVEEKENFLDIEEEAIDKMSDLKKAKKLIRRIVITNKTISLTQLEKEVTQGLEISIKKYKKALEKVLAGSNKFLISNNKISLK